MNTYNNHSNKPFVVSETTIKNKTDKPYGILQLNNNRFRLKKATTTYTLLDGRKINIKETFHKNGRVTIKTTWEGDF